MRFPPDLLRQCRFLAGPTACGKTDVALHLAEPGDSEIVALDSMTLYRGMDIGTAKPSAAERARVPHHLLDILDPHEEFSVADYLASAEAACRAIVGRGRAPLFVGGTALYLRAVLRGVFDGPPADWSLRRELEATAEAVGPAELHRQLKEVDPDAAARLPPADVRRVIRALEVHRLTGRPLSSHHRETPLSESKCPPVLWLSPPRPWLNERINRRVDRMLQDGLMNEVRRLLALPNGLGRTAAQGLGYKEVIAFLKGEGSEAELATTIQARTRQFAKRQLTWFRNLPECRPIEIDGTETPAALAVRVRAAFDESR